MKYLLKRTLALMLAVLMVAGTLPTTAWAARIVDGPVQDTPVLDDDGQVADVLGRPDQGEKPIDPVDPGANDPAAPSWDDMAITNVTVRSDGTWSLTVHSDKGASSPVGNWSLLLIPDVKHPSNAAAVRPSQMRHDTGDAERKFNNTANSTANGLSGLAKMTGMTDTFLVLQTNAGSFGADGNFTLTSADWGKVSNYETLQKNIGTFVDKDGKAVSAMDAQIPYLAVFYSQGGTPDICYAEPQMVYENTNFELVPSTTFIDSAKITDTFDFTLHNATKDDVDNGLATVEAGVPSYVDKITFNGSYKNGTAVTMEFIATNNGLVNLLVTKDIGSQNAPGGNTFQNSTGTITVEYHKDGAPGEKKTIAITVRPVPTGEIVVTPITLTLKAGDDTTTNTKSGSTTITNGRGYDIALLSAEDINSFCDDGEGNNLFGGTAVDSCLPDSIPGGLNVTEGTIPLGTISEDATAIESGLISARGGQLGINNIITVTAPRGTAKGTYNFDLTLNAIYDDESYSGENVTIPVTVIVEVDKEWTVTFDENYTGKPTPMHSVTVADGDVVSGYYPSRTGYGLVGWYSDAGCTDGNEVSFPYTPTGDITVYAKWERDITYRVTYANAAAPAPQLAAGTELPSDSTDYTPGAEVTVATSYAKNTEKANGSALYYKFVGWNDGTATRDPGYKFNINANTTLTAVWEVVNITVTLISGGHGTIPSGWPKTIQKGSATTLPTLTATGWTFGGWAAPSGGTDVGASGGSTGALTQDTTYTAKWTRKQSTIKFVYANGSSTPDLVFTGGTGDTLTSGTDASGNAAAFPATPTGLNVKTGHRFDKWLGVDGTTYSSTSLPNYPSTEGGELVITAQWIELGKVKFLPNGGTWKNSKTNADFQFSGDVGSAPATVPTGSDVEKSGYSFGGWATSSTGTTPVSSYDFATGTWGTNDSDWDSATAYYAIWTEKGAAGKITVKKDNAAYSGLQSKITLKTAGTASVVSATFGAADTNGTYTTAAELGVGSYDVYINNVKTGKQIVIGTGTSSNQTVDYWTVSVSVSPSGVGSAKLQAEGGTAQTSTGTAATDVVLDGTKVTWTFGTASNTNYRTKGWDSTTSTAAFTDVVIDADAIKSHVATYEKIPYTVTFHPEGGDWSPSAATKTATVLSGETITAAKMPANPARTNYTFANWYTAVQGGGTQVTANTTVTGDLDVYAKWTYTITYDTNWGTGKEGNAPTTPSSFTGTAGGTKTTAPSLTTTYYTLEGWYTNQACTAGKVAVGADVPEGTKTLYAKWVQNTADVTVNFKKTAVGGSATAYAVTGTAKLFGTTYTGAATNANSVTITGVPWSATAYDLYFENVDTTVNVTVNAATVSVDVNFYEMAAVSDGNGTATVTAATGALVMTTAGAVATSTTASTATTASASIIVMKGGGVSWSSSNTKANYTFHHWDTNTTTDPSVTNAAAAASHTAHFNKTSFDTTLKVTLNGADQTTSTVGSGKDIVSVKLGTAAATYTGANGVWKVTGVTGGAQSDQWVVETITGNYTVNNGGDMENTGYTQPEVNLYGVKTAAKSTMEDAQAVMTTNSKTGQTRVLVRLNQSITALTVDPADGYTHTGWTVANNAGSEAVNFANKTFALTAAVTQDVVLTPTFTFESTIETRYLSATGTLTNVTSVTLTEAGQATTVATGVKQTANGTYKVSGLDPAKTYDIWVNGFKVGAGNAQIAAANANQTVPVIVFKITAVAAPTAAGTPTVNSAAQVYVPNGAVITTSAPTVTAAQGTVNSGYRWLDQSGETLWTITAGNDVAAITNAGAITTQTGKTVNKDITATAHAVERWTITKAVSGAASGSKVDFGTTPAHGTVSGNAATLDEGSVIAITATTSDEQQIKGWAITGGDGKLYSDAACATQITTPASHTGKTVYAKATTANATVTVTFESREYTINVTVNKDNAPIAGVKVKLGTGTGEPEVTTNSSGVASFTKTAGTYTIYTDATGSMATAVKTVTVNATATAGGTGTETVNYYTVEVVKATTDSGTLPATFYANHGTSASSTGDTSKVFLAKKDATTTLNIAATGNNQSVPSGPYYRFKEWSSKAKADTAASPTALGSFGSASTTAGNTFVLPEEDTLIANTNIKANNGITLTATYQRQYKVSVDLAPGVKSALGSITYPKVATAAPASWETYSSDNTSVLVDGGDSVHVGYSGGNAVWYFKEWSRAADTGTFNASAAVTGTKLGSKKAGSGSNDEYSTVYNAPNTFTPTADSTLYADFWRDASIDSANWTYTQGNVGPNDNNASNQNQLGWTSNDAQTPEITVKTGSSSAITVTAADYDAVTTGGKTTYTLKPAFLNTLPTGNYTATFTYDLGTAGANNSNVYDDLTKTTQFKVALKTYQLTRADIQVKDTTKTTLNVDSTGTQDVAEYKDHAHASIDPLNTLTFKWYYAAEADKPTSTTVPATIPSGWTELTTNATGGFTAGGTAGTYSVIPNYDGGTNNNIKGKYVFAVATAANTGAGTVVSNVIPVDYDAEITVNVDGSAITSGTGYSVYLWPDDGNTFNSTTAIPTTFESGKFVTKGSKLTGGVTYQVWVNEVSGVTSGANLQLLNTNKKVTPAAPTNSVDYYTVTLTDVAAGKVTHAKDNANNDVGENFTGYPTLSAAVTGTTRPVASGAAVLTGTSVTAKSTAWTQDYTMTWQKQATGDTGLVDGTKQNSTAAVNTGYAYGAVTKAVTITAKLAQKTYPITGGIYGTGTLASATLTVNGHTFDGSSTYWQQGENKVSFTVPLSSRTGAINGTYTIAAVAASGTTIQGYDNKASTTVPSPSNTAVTVDGTNNSDRFTIFIATTTLSIKVKDEHDNPDNVQNANPNATSIPSATHTSDMTFWNYDAATDKHNRTITVSNEGNTPLTVTMGITRNGATSAILDGSTTIPANKELTDATASGTTVTFGGLERSFTLNAGESKNFTMTLTNALHVKDSATYTFAFTSMDGRAGVTAKGPDVNFNVTLNVKPVDVDGVATTYDATTDTYTMATTTIAQDKAAGDDHSLNALKKPDASTAPTANDDLVYKWYYADWDAVVELKNGVPVLQGTNTPISAVSGTPSNNGLSYTPTANERGKSLYLVVTGQHNAQGAAMTPDRTKGELPLIVSYGAEIIVRENETSITAGTGYEVYLWRTGSGTFNKTTAIPATWDNTSKSFKTLDSALWPCDPNPDTTDKAAWSYEVYTNVVKGSTEYKKVSGVTINEPVANRRATVDYYGLTVNETTYDNGKYAGKLTGTQFFTGAANKTGFTPTAKVGTIPVASNDTNKWVRKGEAIDLTEAAWTKDYTIAWTNATEQAGSTPAAGSTAKIASITAATAVDTKLTLNLYNVTANVKGMGMVEEITMKLDDNHVFSTKSEGTKILGIGTASSGIAAGGNVVFSLPSGTYTTEATLPTGSAAKLQKYVHGTTEVTYVEGDASTHTIDVAVAGPDSYEVWLIGEGLLMPVKDNVPAGLDSKHTKTEGSGSGQGSIAGSTVIESNATRTIYLNYNYGGPLTVDVEVYNDSKTSAGAVQNLKNVTFTPDGTPKGITASTTDLTAAIPTLATTDGHKKITLTIPDGLAVGDDYTYTATFTFEDESTPANRATVTYTLKVVVEPLVFSGVSVSNTSGTYEIVDYTVTHNKTAGEAAGAALTTTTTPNATETAEDTSTALVKNSDYNYQWYQADVGATVTLDPATAVVTGATAISGETGRSFDSSKVQGKDIYLVISAKTGGNAAQSAISDKLTSDYLGIVYLNVDGTNKTGSTDGADYTVKFVDQGDNSETAASWKQVSTGVYAFVADLEPNAAGYKAKVSRAQGDGTNLIVLDKKLDGSNIGTAQTNSNVTVANYFTVTANPFTNVPYQTGTGEDFTGYAGTPVFAVGGVSLDSGKTVLSGQTVSAKASAAWTQDYTLTWQTGASAAALADTTPAGQAPTAAVMDNAYSQAVTAATVIGGRLDQTVYTVTGSVVGAGEVDRVTLSGGGKVYGTDARPGVDITANNSWTDAGNDGKHNAGDTVTFKVVKGTYTITAYDGTNTTIQKVTVDGGTNVGTARNTNILTEVKTNDRTFVIHLEETDLQLGVTDDQAAPNTKSALSKGLADGNHKHADNVQVIYFDGTNTTDPSFALTLSNPGNADLSVTASAYTLPAGTDYSSISSLTGTALANTGDGVVSIAGLLGANTVVAKGTTDQAAGTLTLDRSAANTADKIYVIKFASTVTDTDAITTAGPTVYYVLDLTVEPLPIKTVEAERLADGKLQLKDTSGANKGLDHITVAYNAAGDTAAANTKGLVDGDFSYIWAKAKPGVTVDASKFELSAGGMAVKSGVTDVELLSTGTGYNTKQFTPADADQGNNFYLIAYRSADTANASEFAVSNAVYAQVTVDIKAYRTGTTTAVDVTETFNVVGTLGEGESAVVQKAQNGSFTVTGDGTKIAFAAGQADNADPTKAKWYFMNWGDTAANFSSTTDLTIQYTVTKKDTVIGYYDLLPELVAPLGYDKSTGKDVPANRTFTYTHNDGSGKLAKIVITGTIEGKTVTHELNDVAFTGVGFSFPAAGFGADGDYVIPESWIKQTAELAEGSYTVTFYDEDKGSLAGGYAGYDRVKVWDITEGEKTVTAQVKDSRADGAETPVYWGTVTIGNGTVTQGPGTSSLTVDTVGNKVNLTATPNAGYVFDKWEIKSGKGEFADTSATPVFTAKSGEVTVEASFKAADYTVTEGKAKVYYGNNAFETGVVQPVATSATASVDYTYDLATADEIKAHLSVETLADNVYYQTADATDVHKVPEWLVWNKNATSKQIEFSVDSTKQAKGVNVRKNAGADVENELVVYVKITSNGGVEHLVPFTVDIMTTPLKIVTPQTTDSTAQTDGEKTAEGAAYKAAYVGAYGTDTTKVNDGKIIHGGDVELDKFAFTYVVSTKNAADQLVAAGNATDTVTGVGAWTVSPTKFNGGGTDPDQNSATYTFTFTYTGVADDPSDDYNYAGSAVDAVIPVQRPARSLEIGDTVANTGDLQKGTEYSAPWTEGGDLPTALDYTIDTFRKGEKLTYLDTEPTYTVKLKRVGSLKDIKLELAPETGKTVAGFAAPTAAEMSAIAARLNADGAETTFTLKLAAVHDKVWVGEHYIRFKLSGKDDLNADVGAYYTISLTMDAKTISSLDVTVTDPETVPTAVTGKTDDNKPVDDKTPDAKGNVPITKTTVTWGPENGPDGKHTEAVVTVETDPNYVYVDDDPATTDTNESITEHTDSTVKEKLEAGGTTNRPTPDPDVVRNGDHKITITQPIPYLMHSDLRASDSDATGPKVYDTRVESIMQGSKDLGQYTIDLGAYGADVFDVKWTVEEDTITAAAGEGKGIGATLGALPGTIAKIEKNGAKQQVVLDLTGADTSKPGTYTLMLRAVGKADPAHSADAIIASTYFFQLTIRAAGGGGPAPEPCPCKVLYHVGSHGTTADATIEDVSAKNRPSKVPAVTPLEGYVFRGWSLSNPATLKSGEKLELVDPKTVEAKGEVMTFYAVIVERPFHEHYVIGYPNGNFGPADNINRASVATIIARAILPDFVEGANYGNPGEYNDVSGHWAESAIAYCSKFGVFEGYTDGTFRPDQPITRQEFATVIARLDGVMTPGEMDFTDIDEAGSWALGGIYTAYIKGWVNGYTDGTFKPLSNIRRDEAVKVFNAYLNRGVDAEGLSDLYEYVHTGAAGNITGNGENEYMTWPDVPKDHWAYYEIVEAANDHQFVVDFESELGHALPEKWEKCWIDERWRYFNEDQTDSGVSAALASAAFGVGLH